MPPCISLATEAAGDAADVRPKWVQVAEEGPYLGYKSGTAPFVITRQTLEDVMSTPVDRGKRSKSHRLP